VSASPFGDNCLFCRLDERCPIDKRPFAYAAVVDMAHKAGADNWQNYTSVCRKHAMQSIHAIVEVNEAMLASAPLEVRDAIRRKVTHSLAMLEAAVIGHFDECENQEEGK
jgi:hypothetical protein